MVVKRTAFILLSMWLTLPAPAADKAWEALTIYPPEVQLATATDFQNVIAVARRSDGVTLDVTDQVAWTVENPELVRFENFRLFPSSDGQTKLLATWQDLAAEASIGVSAATTPRDISFHLDIMPVLTRSGCNTGSCHGAARGKDGFRLSLFGYDPLETINVSRARSVFAGSIWPFPNRAWSTSKRLEPYHIPVANAWIQIVPTRPRCWVG
jgi:hypothetical protein